VLRVMGVAAPTLRLLRVLVDLLRGSKGEKHSQRRNYQR